MVILSTPITTCFGRIIRFLSAKKQFQRPRFGGRDVFVFGVFYIYIISCNRLIVIGLVSGGSEHPLSGRREEVGV